MTGFPDQPDPQRSKPIRLTLTEALVGTVAVMIGWLPVSFTLGAIDRFFGLGLGGELVLVVVGIATLAAAFGSIYLVRLMWGSRR